MIHEIYFVYYASGIHALWIMHHTTCIMYHASCNMQYAICIMHYAKRELILAAGLFYIETAPYTCYSPLVCIDYFASWSVHMRLFFSSFFFVSLPTPREGEQGEQPPILPGSSSGQKVRQHWQILMPHDSHHWSSPVPYYLFQLEGGF